MTEVAEIIEPKSLVTFDSPYAEDVIIEKSKAYEGLVISDNKSYESTKKARTEFVKIRTSIQRAVKIGNEDLMAQVNANKNEAKRLIQLAAPTEQALQAEVKRWEDKKEAEKQAKIKAEEERVALHQARIRNIRAMTQLGFNPSSEAIQSVINQLHETVIDESFEEFQQHAQTEKDQALETLNSVLAEALHTEEVMRQREEEQKRLEEERKRIAAEQAEIERERAAIQAEKDKLEAERIAAEEAQRKAKEEAERIEREKVEAAKREEEAKARAEAEAKAKAEREAEEARIKAEEEAEAKQQAELAAKEREEALPEIEAFQRQVVGFISELDSLDRKTETARNAAGTLRLALENQYAMCERYIEG